MTRKRDCDETLLTHQAVTRDQIAGIVYRVALRVLGKSSSGVLRELGTEIADALLAEKPAPTVTPLTRRDDLHSVIARIMQQPVYNSSEISDAVEQYLERLSAYPPAMTDTAQENER